MPKLYSILKTGFAILSFTMASLVLLLFVLLFIFFFPVSSKDYEKPSVIAGYGEATFFDIHLMLYPDSTYYYSRTDQQGTWIQSADTIILERQDTVQATLVKLKAVEINNPDYHWLRMMQIKEFNPPKVVTFPKGG